MTDKFGSAAGDTSGQETGTSSGKEGTNFGQAADGTTSTSGLDQGIDRAEYEALRQRDENAQQHIPRLESENKELRDKVVELEDKLAKATTLDEALTRISNQGEGQQNVDRTDVAQIVEEVLGQKQTDERMTANWSAVESALLSKYGEWNVADKMVQERAAELDISLQDATLMAKQNPKVFKQLFNLEDPKHSSNPGGSHGTGARGQRGVSSHPGAVRDSAYYSNLRKNDPNKYWSMDTQAQMRRDLYNS